MAATMRVGAVQLPARVEGRSFKEKQERNLQTILEMLRCAGERRPDLVLFGEYANLHHRTWSDDKKEYVPDPIPGRFTRLVAAEARKHEMNIAMPMFGVFEGILSSHVVLFDRSGRIIGTYQKAHPTIAEQEIGIRCGDNLPVFELDCARIGVMTCMDIEYPEVAQALMLRGADLLLFPHVQGSWGELDWEVRYRARAIDTGLYVVSACFGYPEGEWMPGKMIGRTSVVGRDGLILADLGRGIGVLTHDIDLRQKRVTEFFFKTKHDRTLAVAASRRPELYHDLVDERIKASALGRVKSEESLMKRRGRNKKEG
jgi:predicted amidohydrolase